MADTIFPMWLTNEAEFSPFTELIKLKAPKGLSDIPEI